MDKSKKNRRQFLKNSSLTTLAIGLIPSLAKGENKESNLTKKSQDASIVDCEKTTLDYYGEGPFYTENPPTIENNILVNSGEAGQRIVISGRVQTLDCEKVIPDTIIDIWHADDDGAYDNTGFKFRGITHTNSQGFYVFETILPGKYLNGSRYRPSHIHFKITPPGFSTLTTQLYFEGDTDIPEDAAASITSGQYDASARIIPLVENTDGKLEGTWDIVIDGDGITLGINDIHIDKGMIYSISPNPFSTQVEIKYGVFKNAQVGLLVYDIQGRLVASLEESQMSPEKYTAVWNPDSNLPNGHYFVALKINDLQVHYLKVNYVK